MNRFIKGSIGLRQPDITRQTGQSRAKRHGGRVNTLQMEWDTWDIWSLKTGHKLDKQDTDAAIQYARSVPSTQNAIALARDMIGEFDGLNGLMAATSGDLLSEIFL